MRGDTDFYLTAHLDRWAEIVDFLFGADAYPALVRLAEGLAEARYGRLKRKSEYTVNTQERDRPENVEEQIVEQLKNGVTWS